MQLGIYVIYHSNVAHIRYLPIGEYLCWRHVQFERKTI